jgi:3-phosphoinositide dependent protein kinase-1
MATAISTQDWLEALDRAKELAASQDLQSAYNAEGPYNAEENFNISSSALSSHASTLDHQVPDVAPPEPTSHHGRGALHKQHSSADSESVKGRKRFSKRQSKSGLTAVF